MFMWLNVCLLYGHIFSLIIIHSCKDVIFILTKRIDQQLEALVVVVEGVVRFGVRLG